MKTKPELITDNYQPSDNLIKWCNDMGITSSVIERELPGFIFYNKEKKKRRSNFNRAFQFWLKNSIKFTKRDEQTIKRGSQSFAVYVPGNNVVSSKSVGRAALKDMLRR